MPQKENVCLSKRHNAQVSISQNTPAPSTMRLTTYGLSDIGRMRQRNEDMFLVDDRNRVYAVEVPRDCVASLDPEAHEFALKHMEKVLGAKVV